MMVYFFLIFSVLLLLLLISASLVCCQLRPCGQKKTTTEKYSEGAARTRKTKTVARAREACMDADVPLEAFCYPLQPPNWFGMALNAVIPPHECAHSVDVGEGQAVGAGLEKGPWTSSRQAFVQRKWCTGICECSCLSVPPSVFLGLQPFAIWHKRCSPQPSLWCGYSAGHAFFHHHRQHQHSTEPTQWE